MAYSIVDSWLMFSITLTLTLLVPTIVGAPQPESNVDHETRIGMVEARLGMLEQDTHEIKDALKQLIMTLSVTMNEAKEIEEHSIVKRDVTETVNETVSDLAMLQVTESANETATETVTLSANLTVNEIETPTLGVTSTVTQRPTEGPTEGADDLQSVLTGFGFNVNGLVALLNAKDKVYNEMVNERINDEVASLIHNLTEYQTQTDDKLFNLTQEFNSSVTLIEQNEQAIADANLVGEQNERAIAAVTSDVAQNERAISAVSSGVSSARSSIQSNSGRISLLNSQLQSQIPIIASNAQCPCWSSTSPCRANDIYNNYIKNCKSGYIVSPNYPSNYGNNANYEWRVENPGYSSMRITWYHYEVESRGVNANGVCNIPYDYLQSLGTNWCTVGPGSSGTHHVSGVSSIPMKFISDGSVTNKGFEIKFEFF